MTRRILATVGLSLAALLLVVLLLLAWFLGTQSGSRVLWSGVTGAVGGLTAEAVDGRFGGALSLRGLRFETDRLRLAIGSLQLDWAPARLLGGALILEKLHLDDVSYTQLKPAPPAEDAEPFTLPKRLSLPVAIELRDIALRSLDYRGRPKPSRCASTRRRWRPASRQRPFHRAPERARPAVSCAGQGDGAHPGCVSDVGIAGVAGVASGSGAPQRETVDRW